MSLTELIQNQNITLNLKPSDLEQFANEIALKVMNEVARNQAKPNSGETYLTTDEVCKKLSVTRVTLWSWDRKGITQPIRMGNLKRYRQSEIENIGK